MIQFQEYLQSDYPGFASFIDTIIKPIFGDNFKAVTNIDDMIDCLKEDPEELEHYDEIAKSTDEGLKSLAEESGLERVLKLGTIQVQGDTRPIYVYDITVSNRRQLSRNRKGIQQLIARTLNNQSGAFMLFHYGDADWEWRFSYKFVGKDKEDSTDSKRYTYLLGRDQVCKTAAQRFTNLLNKKGKIAFDDITDAFSVEKVSKEFFEKYKVHYGRFVGHVIGKEYIDKGDGKGEWREKEGLKHSELFNGLGNDEKRARDYIKKLLGRIVFLHFLQKKGWLGATDAEWTNGPQDFMFKLFNDAKTDQKGNFLDDILEPLFSCLDTPLNERREVFDTKVDGLRSVRVPFLGGLFERTEEDKAISIFPYKLFADLFKFLSEYNFTIDENDPNDAQVGVDPEMLGRIFENLLEDNKDKGAFYTPKEIVQYMCRESLIAYLQTNVTDEATREVIRQFVTTHDVNVLGGKESALAQNVSQCLKDVKICDPAIGSGAFPMGLLNELFLCRGVIEDFANAATIKRHIIQQNIYGVDIEKGAVEIARLRFWLSLITDADTPEVLPNMDFKIMQGNSLLEQYKGFDLSHIMETKTEIHAGHQFQMFEDQIDVIRAEVKDSIKRYYGEQNHDMRRTMREGIQQKIQQQIRTQGYNVDISDIKDIAATDQFFLWHTWFSEVFEEGGFDIVIGNPPYISAPSQIANAILAKLREDIINSKKFESLYQKWDLYIPFIEHGIQLASHGGIITMIVPYPLTNQTYGKKLREMIVRDYDMFELCDLNGTKIFENATVSNCIPFVRKSKPEAVNTVISHIASNKVISCSFYKNEDDLVPDKKTAVWNVGEEKRDANRHADMHVLGDFCFVSYGLRPNSDEKTAKGEFKKADLISEIEDSMHSRKYVEAKDIDKYKINRVRFLEYDTDRSPSKLVRPTFREWFKVPKLFFNRLGNLVGTYDDEEYYIHNDSIIGATLWKELIGVQNNSISSSIKKFSTMSRSDMERLSTTVDLKYLLGIMNSKYTDVLLTNLRAGDYHIYPEHIRNIAIPNAIKEKQQPIITLVDHILSLKKQNPQADTSALEHEIDLLVYDLYGLTPEEIAIVEGTSNA